MTEAEQLAAFVVGASYDDISESSRGRIKVVVLDALACAIGSLGAEPIRCIREQVDDFGGADRCTLIGGGRTAPDRAAFYNSGLVRYLDFNDSYLGRNGTCHPSDNLGAVLAAAEYARGSGKEFMTALAVAYQVVCRLCDEAPIMTRGYDHPTAGAYAVAAGVSRALGLNESQTANAVGISGAAFNSLGVIRTGDISHWKGLSYPNTCFGGTHAAFLAMHGVTGPIGVFEGTKGLKEVISGPFEIHWPEEDLEKTQGVCIKKYTAGVYAQSAVEGVIEIREQEGLRGADVEKIDIDIYDVAYKYVGGGEAGDKHIVHTKEDADHSIPYMVAAALLEGALMPEQYRDEFLHSEEVQGLLRKVVCRPSDEYSARYPKEMPCTIRVTCGDGRIFERTKSDYEGFYARPMGWESVVGKFSALCEGRAGAGLQKEIADAVEHLDAIAVSELTGLLEKIG